MLFEPVVFASIVPVPIAVLSAPVVFCCKQFIPIATFLLAVVFACKAPFPTAVFLSPVVIAVPASLPNKALFSASVPVKLSPAFVPATVLPCASLVTPVSTCAQVRPPVLPD